MNLYQFGQAEHSVLRTFLERSFDLIFSPGNAMLEIFLLYFFLNAICQSESLPVRH
jgi:hypothetical protein